MKSVRWDIGWGAILALSLAYFFDDTGLFAACVPAILAHELGHVAALRCFGANVRKVSIRIYGAKIDYSGVLSVKHQALALASGPISGALYSLAAYVFLGSFGKLSAMASAVMTVFNALPIMPLDGGEVVACLLGKSRARRISVIFSLAAVAFSLVLLFTCNAAAPLLVSTGLLLLNILPAPQE